MLFHCDVKMSCQKEKQRQKAQLFFNCNYDKEERKEEMTGGGNEIRREERKEEKNDAG